MREAGKDKSKGKGQIGTLSHGERNMFFTFAFCVLPFAF
jgi:hypothetical protein